MAVGSSTSLTFDLLAKDKTASRTFERFGRTVDDTDSKVSKIGTTMANVGKTAAKGLAVGVAAAGVALVAFGKSAVEEAREAQKVGKQTEAVIKSTGGAAKVTAGHVEELAGKLSMKAGIDDEVIQSGQNLMLTFTNIRNEVGKGNAIFDRATTTALDMSVALGKDLRSSTLLVSKALNDPIKGMSSLSRVGITFTEQQEKNIEKLVEEGKVLKAQKIILGELDKKFAGSAEAQATAGAKAKVAWENFQEQIGAKLLPLLDKLAMFFVNDVVPALQRFSAWFQSEAIPVIKRFATQGQELLMKFVAWVRQHWPEIRAVIVDVLTTIKENFQSTVDIITRIWRKWGDDLFRILGPVLQNIGTQVRAALKILRGIFDVFAGLLKGDWGQMWDGFKQIFGGAWDSLKGNIKTQLKVLKAIFGSAWDAIKDVFEGAWDKIMGVVKFWMNAVKTYYVAQFKIWRMIFSKVWDAVKTIFTKAWDVLKNVVKTGFEAVKAYYSTQFKIWKTIFGKAWDAVKAIFDRAWDGLKTLVTNKAGDMKDSIVRFFTQTIPDVFRRAFDAMRRVFEAGVSGIGKIWDRLKRIAAAPVNFIINTVYNNGIRKVVNAIPGVGDLPEVSPIGFDRGGYTGDIDPNKIAGAVHGREFVINAKSTAKIKRTNPGFLERLNKMGMLPGHRKGGFVNPMGRVYVDGEPLTAIHAAQLAIAGNLMGTHQSVIQGSWQAPSSYSGTSHTGPGVADTSPGSFRAQYVQRRAGIAAWARNIPGAAYAGSGAHVHGVSMFSAPGNSQLASYRAGGDGLGGSDYGARPGLLPGLRALLSAFNISNLISGGLGGFNAAATKESFLEGITGIWDKINSMKDKGGWWPMLAKAMGFLVGAIKDYGLQKIKDFADKAQDQFFPVPITGPGGLIGMANGGIVTRPTAALIGERGPEAVVPLNRRRNGPTRVVIDVAGNQIEGVIREIVREEVADEFRYMGSGV